MKLISACLFLLTLNITSFGQKFHLDFYGGASNYQGDLQYKRYTFKEACVAFGAGISYEISDHLLLRTALTIAKVAADDKFNAPDINRNLNFTSPITEGQVAVQYFFRNMNDSRLAPYVFAGLALYHFNPYTFDSTGTRVYLHSLSTEGEGFVPGKNAYSLTQAAIPFGGGIKLALSDDIHVGLEVGLRKLFTDYLDDVSTTYVDQALLLANRGQQAVSLAYRGGELKNGAPYPVSGDIRGGSKYKDWYYFSLVTLSFRLGHNTTYYRSNSRVGCPTRLY